MKINKKQGIIIGAALTAVVVTAAAIFVTMGKGGKTNGDPDSQVYVDSIRDICGLGSGNGLTDRYSGIVEPQKTWEIPAPSDKKVDEILVKEGDEVKVGDKLFTYNTEEMEENLAQAEIDLERLGNEIEQTKEQITALKKEKASAPSEEQLSYTTQINTAENDIKRKEYEQKSKKAEIGRLKNSIANATVTSEMDGVVKSINSAETSDMNSMMGETTAFMTILAVGDFRIKATVNEQNMSTIVEGQPVLVHSRVDDTVWKGTLSAVDLDNPEKNDSNMMYMGPGESGMDTSSNYPFYVELESVEGLMLGQHVYVEMDYGQSEPKEGIWLDSYYIIQEDEKAWVWAATSKDKMEKREITLGEFDEGLQKYQVTEGLTEEDYIAFPDETIKEGDQAIKNVDQTTGMENMGGMDGMEGGEVPAFDENSMGDGMMEPDDGMDGGMMEEDMYDGDAAFGEDDYSEEDYDEEDGSGAEDLSGGMDAADLVNEGMEETE